MERFGTLVNELTSQHVKTSPGESRFGIVYYNIGVICHVRFLIRMFEVGLLVKKPSHLVHFSIFITIYEVTCIHGCLISGILKVSTIGLRRIETQRIFIMERHAQSTTSKIRGQKSTPISSKLSFNIFIIVSEDTAVKEKNLEYFD